MIVHIGTVLADQHIPAWVINQSLIQKQNQSKNLKFHIVAPKEQLIELQRSLAGDVQLYELQEPDIDNVPKKYFGSYQHGHNLDLLCGHIRSEFYTGDHLIILDPDFFVVGEAWINSILVNSENQTLVTPWHPRWVNKSDRSYAIHLLSIGEVPSMSFKPRLKRRSQSKLRKIIISSLDGLIKFWAVRPKENGNQSVRDFSHHQYFIKTLRIRLSRGYSRDTAFELYPYLNQRIQGHSIVSPLIPSSGYIVDTLYCDFGLLNFGIEKFFPGGLKLYDINIPICKMPEQIESLFRQTNWEYFEFRGVYMFHVRGYMNEGLKIRTTNFSESIVCKNIENLRCLLD